jgi:hypothetical protein
MKNNLLNILKNRNYEIQALKFKVILIMFESVVVVAFQNIFYLKMHQNNIFLFF